MKEKTKKCLLSMKRGKAEIIALILYVIGVSVISYFHEPWFDEAQAWQIARCASIKDILFQIPHYEGHPPLWHLVLAPFAKFGAPYEFTLSAINITFCTAAVALILFKSPFPKIVRCLIPFSYFFFYQYGVISRPYSMMMLAFVLMAITYTNRNNKPLLYVLSLGFLCLTQAFGIIIAGGLSLVWVWEIFIERKREKTLKELFRDKRCWCLFGLAVLAIFIIVNIIPAEDVYYQGVEDTWADKIGNLTGMFTIPFDSLFGVYLDVETIKLSTSGLIASCIGGFILTALIILFFKDNRKLLTFTIPYALLMAFSLSVYFSYHHIGIYTMYFVFITWITISEDSFSTPKSFKNIWSKINSSKIKNFGKAVITLLLIMPFSWTICSSINEVKNVYGIGRGLSAFIKLHNMEEKKIMVSWKYVYNIEDNFDYWGKNTSDYDDTEMRVDYTNIIGNAATSLPYFDSNIYMNFNVHNKQEMYLENKLDANSKEVFKRWSEQGVPDILIGKCTLSKIYPESVITNNDYVRVAEIESSSIWKFSILNNTCDIYIRKDLLSEYPTLKEIKY